MVAADAMHREIRDDASPSHRRVSGEDRCVVVRPEMMNLSVVALGEIALHRRTHPFVGVGALDLGRLLQRLEPAETTHDPAALLEQERAIRRDRGAVERGHGHGALAQPPIPPVFAFLRPAEDPAEAPYDRAKDGERSVRSGSGDEQERPDLETPSAQQAGYLVCRHLPEKKNADEVRSLWERGMDQGGILEGHRFDLLAPGYPVGSVRRESVHGSLPVELACEMTHVDTPAVEVAGEEEERDGFAPRLHADQRRRRAGEGRGDSARERSGRRRAEQALEAHVFAAAGTDAGDEAGGPQRISPAEKKIVVDADTFEAQYLRENLDELRFEERYRGAVGSDVAGALVREESLQLVTLHFAGRCARKFGEEEDSFGDLDVGEVLGGEAAQFALRPRRVRPEDHRGSDLLGVRRMMRGEGRCLGDGVVRPYDLFDLVWNDFLPAGVDQFFPST